MIRCEQCGRPALPEDLECPECGSQGGMETLWNPPKPSPHERWKARPARLRVSWPAPGPSVGVIRRVLRSGAFPHPRESLLAAARAGTALVSNPMTYGDTKEWLAAHQQAVEAEVLVEVLFEREGWVAAPEKP